MLEKLQEIMWRVTAAGDLNEALEIVVRRVKAAMNTDVCSVYGVVSRNRRKFRHPHAGPATSASRSRLITLASLWNV
jgi:signal transduction protein with GAF and PtsI domain